MSDKKFKNVFDKDIYGPPSISDSEYTFPVSVLIVEPEIEVQDPSYVYAVNTDKVIPLQEEPKWNTCAFIKFLATKQSLSQIEQDECNKCLLKLVLDKYKSRRFIFAATKLDNRYFQKRNFHRYGELNEMTQAMSAYYSDAGIAPWITSRDDMKHIEEMRVEKPDKYDVITGRIQSITKQNEYKPPEEKFREYENLGDIARIFKWFGFKSHAVYNSDVSCDFDNMLNLDYKAHLMFWENRHMHSIPGVSTVDHSFRILMSSTRNFCTVQFTYFSDAEALPENGDFTLMDACKRGTFTGFGDFWRNTYLPLSVLNQRQGKVLFLLKYLL